MFAIHPIINWRLIIKRLYESEDLPWTAAKVWTTAIVAGILFSVWPEVTPCPRRLVRPATGTNFPPVASRKTVSWDAVKAQNTILWWHACTLCKGRSDNVDTRTRAYTRAHKSMGCLQRGGGKRLRGKIDLFPSIISNTGRYVNWFGRGQRNASKYTRRIRRSERLKSHYRRCV